MYGFRDLMWETVQEPHFRATAMLRGELAEMKEEEFAGALERGEVVDAAVVGEYFEAGWPGTWVLRRDVGPSEDLLFIQADGGFFLMMRLAFWLALAVSAPYLLWELWGFIASGLYRKEKKIGLADFPTSMALFFGGVFFGYFVLIPYGLFFLNLDGLSRSGSQYLMESEKYLNFLKGLCLALGFVFQLPIIMVALSSLGLVAPRTYSQYRKHMLLAALVVGAILTPPDPITQMMMAGPIIVLYELGLRIAYLIWKEPLADLEDEELDSNAEGAGNVS